MEFNPKSYCAPRLNLALQFCTVILLLALAQSASANTIDFSSSSGGWTVSGAGATNATPFILGGGGLSFTDNGRRTGNFVPGASLVNFDGYWTATFSFFLPANAPDLLGTLLSLSADDRVVLYLNGSIIADGGLGIPQSGSIAGMMELTDGGGDQPFTFDSSDSSGSGTGGFILGGTNTLFAVINNTGSGVTGTTRTFTADGDGATFHIQGSITYAPEPASWALLLAGPLVALVRFRHRVRS